MSPARISAGQPNRRSVCIRVTAAAKEAILWPEGKEKSVGGAMSSVTRVLTSKGLTLAIKGFSVRFPTTRQSTRAVVKSQPPRR